MGRDFSTLLADSMVKGDGDLPLRLEAQDEALAELECEDERLGMWVDAYETAFLFNTLALSDEIFFAEFPDLPSLSRPRREQLAMEIEQHAQLCARCQRKVAYDLEWEARVTKAMSENKQLLGALLADE
jgi:hypothetical protein